MQKPARNITPPSQIHSELHAIILNCIPYANISLHSVVLGITLIEDTDVRKIRSHE